MGVEVLQEVGLGQGQDPEELPAPFRGLPPGKLHPRLLREPFQGLGEVQPLRPLDEGEEVAPGLAPEAVEEALLLVHVERGGLLLVEGAEALPAAAARRLQGHVAGDHLPQGEAGLDQLHRLARVHAAPYAKAS